MKYQLPCPCGKMIPIDTAQAGQTVTCSCGAQLDVPTMRTIRQLEPVTEPDSTAPGAPRRAQRKQGSWPTIQRVLFSLGLALATCAFLVAGYFQWVRSRLDTREVVWDKTLESDLDRLKVMGLNEAWVNWVSIRDTGIGPFFPPPYIQARMLSARFKSVVLTAGGIGICGLLLMGTALVLPQRPSRPAGRKRAPPAR